MQVQGPGTAETVREGKPVVRANEIALGENGEYVWTPFIMCERNVYNFLVQIFESGLSVLGFLPSL